MLCYAMYAMYAMLCYVCYAMYAMYAMLCLRFGVFQAIKMRGEQAPRVRNTLESHAHRSYLRYLGSAKSPADVFANAKHTLAIDECDARKEIS